MKESPISPEDEYDVALKLVEKFVDSFRLPGDREAAKAQIEEMGTMIREYAQKKCQEGELRGRMDEVQVISNKLVDLGIPVFDYHADDNYSPVGYFLAERYKSHKSQLERKEQQCG